MEEMGLNEDDFVSEGVAPTFSANSPNSHKKTISFPETNMQISFNPHQTFAANDSDQDY